MSQTPQQKIKAMQTMLGRWKNRPVMDYRREKRPSCILSRMKSIRLLLVHADETAKLEKNAELDNRMRQTARMYAEVAYSMSFEHLKDMPRGGMYAVTVADILRRIEKTPLLTDELKKQVIEVPKPAKRAKRVTPPEPCKMCRHRQDDYCEAVGAKCKEALRTRGCDAPPEILPPREEHV